MRYKLLFKSELKVTGISPGTITFCEYWGSRSGITESRKIINAFLNTGGNLNGTANNYKNGLYRPILGSPL